MMTAHHDASVRTTIDLPPELHRILASLASTRRVSVSQTAVELMEQGLRAQGDSPAARVPTRSKRTGLPLIRLQRVVTPEDVRAVEEES